MNLNFTFSGAMTTQNFSRNNATLSFSTYMNAWSAVFFIVLSLNFVGNVLVVLVILMESKFHSSMNFLFVNMAVSDFFAGVFALLWYIANYVAPEWRSEWVCRVVAANTITVLSGLVSIFTLTAITLERYKVILKPLEHRMSWTRFKVILFVIWTLSIILSSPYVIVMDFVLVGNQTRQCMQFLGLWQRQLLSTFAFVFMYIFPNVIICFAYARIVRHLWFREENNEMQESHQALLRSRKKITKLLGTILVMFNLCTFPNFVADFMLSFHAVGYGHKFAQAAFLIQLASTCVNPLIFFIQSGQFRKRLLQAFRCRRRVIDRWSTLRGTTGSSKSQNCPMSRQCRTNV